MFPGYPQQPQISHRSRIFLSLQLVLDLAHLTKHLPEQLFHRKWLHITSEALAGTRARGVSMALDRQIELDLLT
ncbi:hypothetical protein S245_002819, partial [Arachis hypogaea]